jgi:hypothetical protein
VSRRVALVTGGARGIGLGIARSLSREGFDLALCGRRPEADAAVAIEGLRGLGATTAYVTADVASAPDRERLVAAVRARFGCLHVLVNNAGIAPSVRADLRLHESWRVLRLEGGPGDGRPALGRPSRRARHPRLRWPGDAPYSTGAVITVDGGLTIPRF